MFIKWITFKLNEYPHNNILKSSPSIGVFKDIISIITIKESKYVYYNDLKSLVIEKTFSDEPIFIQITKTIFLQNHPYFLNFLI